MRVALVLVLMGLVAWVVSLSPAFGRGGAISDGGARASSPDVLDLAACRFAARPEGAVPAFVASPVAELLPAQMPTLRKAYFSMGCFWGSEAMLASCPGVEFTRVGFTGGTTPDPSYSAIGDHVETVEVLFDPARTSYRKLLEHFWRHHNARAKPVFRQYASAVFAVDAGQQREAVSVRELLVARDGAPLLTAVKPFSRFYPAQADHQKYYLGQDSDLLARMPRDGALKLETRLATKLNAVAGHCGDRADVKAALLALGLGEPMAEGLLLRASWPAVEAR